jgi:hypothetical protein
MKYATIWILGRHPDFLYAVPSNARVCGFH